MEHAILREIGELLTEALEIAERVFIDKAYKAARYGHACGTGNGCEDWGAGGRWELDRI